MKPLLTLTDQDLFGGEDISHFPENKRIAVRAIIFDEEDNIALVGVGTHILPGGGVEEGEGLEDAVKRECIEEVGCTVEILSYLGFTEDSRAKRGFQTTHCFVTKVIGDKGRPTTTQEDEKDMMLDWMSLSEALTSLKEGRDKYSDKYNFSFNIRSHIVFLEEYMRTH